VREIIGKAKAKGAERCEVFYLNSLNTEVEYEASRLKNVSNTEEKGYALRLVKDGRLGFATTTKADGIDRLVDDALATSTCGDKVGYSFAPLADLREIPTIDPAITELSLEDMMTRSEDAIAKVLDYEGEINVSSGTNRRQQTVAVATSEGFEGTQERTLYQFYVSGLLVEGDNMLDCGAI